MHGFFGKRISRVTTSHLYPLPFYLPPPLPPFGIAVHSILKGSSWLRRHIVSSATGLHDDQMHADIYDYFSKASAWTVTEGAVEALQHLKKSGETLYSCQPPPPHPIHTQP